MHDQAFEQWINASEFAGVASSSPLSGGSICNTQKVVTRRGDVLCVKQLDGAQGNAPQNFFKAEAIGLQALQQAQQAAAELDKPAVLIPRVKNYSESYIAMDYIAPGAPTAASWQRLAQGLALMHRQPAPFFGFEVDGFAFDNYCGLTPQPNTPCADGFEFFARHRLLFQGRLAFDNNHFTKADLQQLEALANKLPQLIPEQPACLIHGDLWSGNVMFDSDGTPVLIDPACYYGWAEAELAMTALFGGFPDTFYRHYQTVNPLEPGWRERFPLYNLYHLLNHLNLFGGHYYGQARAIIKSF